MKKRELSYPFSLQDTYVRNIKWRKSLRFKVDTIKFRHRVDSKGDAGTLND